MTFSRDLLDQFIRTMWMKMRARVVQLRISGLFLFISFVTGFSAMANAEPQTIPVEFHFKEIKGVDLPSGSYPDSGLEVKDEAIDRKKTEVFRSLIEQFQRSGDPLLNEVFSSLHRDRQFSVQVVATTGVPQPYDAWTGPFAGEFAIFFNLSDWTENELKESGLAVVKHEVTHVLLEPLLNRPGERDYQNWLDFIILNEGIAHLVGYPGDRMSLVAAKGEKWKKAEDDLARAREVLASPSVSAEEKQSLVRKASAGPFWEKYAAISGMFRAAWVYQAMGAEGIIRAIQAGRLEIGREQPLFRDADR